MSQVYIALVLEIGADAAGRGAVHTVHEYLSGAIGPVYHRSDLMPLARGNALAMVEAAVPLVPLPVSNTTF